MEQKVIGFNKGIHRNPTISESGELIDCVDLVVKNQELMNAPRMKCVKEDIPEGYTLLFVHETRRSVDNYIYWYEGTETIEDVETEVKKIVYYNSDTDNGDIDSFTEKPIQTNCIGNTLVFTFSDSIQYYLWKEGKYVNIPNTFNINVDLGLEGHFVTKISEQKLSITKSADAGYDADVYKWSGEWNINAGQSDSKTFTPTEKTVFEINSYKFFINITTDITAIKIILSGVLGSGDKVTLVDEYYGMFTPVNGNYNFNAGAYVYFTTEQDYTKFELYIEKIYDDSYNYGTGAATIKAIELYTKDESSFKGDFIIKNSEENYNVLIGEMNSFIKKNGPENDRFVYPFFVRYGLKDYKGKVVYLSEPRIMIPNSRYVPFVWERTSNIDEEGDYNFKMSAVFADMYMKVTQSEDIQTLKKQEDIIKKFFICISSPIPTIYNTAYTYDKDDYLNLVKETSTVDNQLQYSYCSFNLGGSDSYISNVKSGKWGLYSIMSTLNQLFYNSEYYRLEYPENKKADIIGSVTKMGEFFNIYETKVEDLTAGESVTISLDEGVLGTYSTREQITDSNVIYDAVSYAKTFTYNNRLHLYQPTRKLYNGSSIKDLHGVVGTYVNGNLDQDKHFYRVVAERYVDETNTSYEVIQPFKQCYDIDVCWWYAPFKTRKVIIYKADSVDTGAVELSYKYYKTECVPTECSIMKGCFVYQWDCSSFGFTEITDATEIAELEYARQNRSADGKDNYVEYNNQMLYSEVNEPFSYPEDNALRIGNGKIKKLAVTTMAMTQDQHGKSPLFALCSDGLWSLTVRTDGTYSVNQSIVRDILNDSEEVLQLDNAFIFPTNKGLMMMQDGNLPKCISGNLDGILENKADYYPFDGVSMVLENEKFVTLLESAKMLWDADNSFVHVFNGSDKDAYHYILNVENGEWSRSSEKVPDAIVPVYPRTLIQVGQKLYQYSKEDDNTSLHKGLLMTREYAFDEPFAMKMLYDLRVSKKIATIGGKCRVAVWVSNDRVAWTRLKSLKARSYKWYRFSVLTSMSDVDAVEGIVCIVDKRRYDKLR